MRPVSQEHLLRSGTRVSAIGASWTVIASTAGIVLQSGVIDGSGGGTILAANGGVVTKLRLLEIEGARIGDEGPGLFDDLPMAVKAPRHRSSLWSLLAGASKGRR